MTKEESVMILLYGNCVTWLTIGLLFLLFELSNSGLFFFISFFFGALAAALIAGIMQSWVVELSVFLVVSAIMFCVLRMWTEKQCTKKMQRTNIDALIGTKGLVLQSIEPFALGYVKVGTEIWAARSDMRIEVGDEVEVVMVRGAHLVVKKVLM
jgi:membrane protein implicated in regulation of membrane protease activity